MSENVKPRKVVKRTNTKPITSPCSVNFVKLDTPHSHHEGTTDLETVKRKLAEIFPDSDSDTEKSEKNKDIKENLDQESNSNSDKSFHSGRESPVGEERDPKTQIDQTVPPHTTNKNILPETTDSLNKADTEDPKEDPSEKKLISISPPTPPKKPPVQPIKTAEEMTTFTPYQMVELVPKCASIKDVEQFVTTVDALNTQIDAAARPIFLAIIKAKIIDKAFNAIKGKNLATWAELKKALETGLDERVDMATASNKLTHMKQKPSESLKDYVDRVKDALAILDKAAIREFADESIRSQVLKLNDANAKNTFEAGMTDIKLKTVVVAAQRESFNASYTFAINQAQTNFPEEKPADSKAEAKKKIECFYCNKTGHLAKECFSRKNRINRANSFPPRNFNPNRIPFNRFTRRSDSGDLKNTTSPNGNNNGNRYNSESNNVRSNNTGNNNYNVNRNGNNTQGNNGYRTNWYRPNNGQNSNSYPSTSSNNRSQENRKVRIIREEETVDWNEISPIDTSDRQEGN